MASTRRKKAEIFTQRHETNILLDLARKTNDYSCDYTKDDEIWIATKKGNDHCLQDYIIYIIDDIIYSLEYGSDLYKVSGAEWPIECGFSTVYVSDEDSARWELMWNDEYVGKLIDDDEIDNNDKCLFIWDWEEI